MSNPVDVALVRLAVSRGLLSPTDGQQMESLHQQGQGSALQLLEARGLAVADLRRSFGGTPFGCTSCGFSCASNQLSRLTPDLRCPQCRRAALAPGRSASGRMPVSGSSLVRPTGTFPAARHQSTSSSFVPQPPHGSSGPPSGYATHHSNYAAPPSGQFAAAPPSGQFAAPPPSGRLGGPPSTGHYGAAGRDSRVDNSGGSHMPRAQTVIRAGGTIGGYQLGKELGRGACGHVFLARRPGLSREFAVKVLRQNMLGNAEAVTRFFREADVASKLNDPGVVSAFDVGQDGQHCYYVMDHCPGQTLKERLRERPYTIPEAVELVQELARIQGVAHSRGVVHRDFKPSNIILAAPDGRPRVTDFGLARDTSAAKGQSLSRTGDLIGTPIYMSPEQLMGERADVRADVYALGVILYELLCGKRPFEAPTTVELASMVLDGRPTPPRSINSSVDTDLEAIVLRALAKDRDDRYANGSALESALAGYREHNGPISRDPSDVRPPPRARARTRAQGGPSKLPLIAAVVAVLACTGVGVGLFVSYQAEQDRQLRQDVFERAVDSAQAAAQKGEWGDVRKQLHKAVEAAGELEDPSLLVKPLEQLGRMFVDSLQIPLASDFQDVRSRLHSLEKWPGFTHAPALAELIKREEGVLGVRESLASVSRDAGQGRPYLDLHADLETLAADVDSRLKPYVHMAQIDLALRRCKLRRAEGLSNKLQSVLRLPEDVERRNRLAYVVSLLWQERHDEAQRAAEQLADSRWTDSPEVALADCLARYAAGEVGAAQDRVRAVVENHPDWLPGKIYGAVLIYSAEEGGHARDWLAEVNEREPDNHFMHYAATLAAAREQSMSDAQDHFNAAMEGAEPPFLDLILAQASMHMFSMMGRGKAEALLQQAEAVYPNSGQPRLVRSMGGIMQGAMLAFRGGQPQEGERLVEEAADAMRSCREQTPKDFERTLRRIPGRWRDGVLEIAEAPRGKVLQTVGQVMQRAMMGGGRRR